jgi:hypothetical protein
VNERPVVVVLFADHARAVRELAAMDGVTPTQVVERAVWMMGAAKTMQWTDAAAIRAAALRGGGG